MSCMQYFFNRDSINARYLGFVQVAEPFSKSSDQFLLMVQDRRDLLPSIGSVDDSVLLPWINVVLSHFPLTLRMPSQQFDRRLDDQELMAPVLLELLWSVQGSVVWLQHVSWSFSAYRLLSCCKRVTREHQVWPWMLFLYLLLHGWKGSRGVFLMMSLVCCATGLDRGQVNLAVRALFVSDQINWGIFKPGRHWSKCLSNGDQN